MRLQRMILPSASLASFVLVAFAQPASAQMVWKEVKTKTSPPSMVFHAMAYDSARQRTVLFSSNSYHNSPFYRETWEYDGLDWVKRKPAVSPTARRGHGMVYDVARRVVVMYGGYDFMSRKWFDETWEYDGITWLLRRPATRPPPTAGHMVYDSLRRVTVLLIPGKFVSGKYVPTNDIWEWNGRNWRQRYLATTLLAGKAYDQGMVYDSARCVVSAVRGGNVWEWDGHSKIGWRNRRVTGPPGGWGRIVYDEARRRTVWYGNSMTGNSVWEWDGTSWRRDPALFKPGRSWHSMVYDSKRQRVVLFSGAYIYTRPNDTWEYYPTHRGTATPAGAGCAGSAGIPTLTGDGPPILGNRDFRVRIDSAKPHSLALVGLALKPWNVAIGGCTLFLDLTSAPILVGGRSDLAGTLQLPLPIPFNPALRGFRLEAQGFINDPQGTYFRLLAFTNGLRLLIGD